MILGAKTDAQTANTLDILDILKPNGKHRRYTTEGHRARVYFPIIANRFDATYLPLDQRKHFRLRQDLNLHMRAFACEASINPLRYSGHI